MTTVLKSIGINFETLNLLIKNNKEILENHDELCEDSDYNKDPFIKYLRIIDTFKTVDSQEKLIRLILSLQTYIINYQESMINPNKCKQANVIEEINKTWTEFAKITTTTLSDYNEIVFPLYEDIKSVYDLDEKSYRKCLIDDIKEYFNLNYESEIYKYYKTFDKSIDEKEINEEEAKYFLKERNIKEVIFPANADIREKLIRLQQTTDLRTDLSCGNLMDQMIYLRSDYNLKYNKLLTTLPDNQSKIDWDKDNLYAENYDRLYNCLLPLYNGVDVKGKSIIKNILPDESFDTETFGFSFENGLTYYHINKNTPSVISTKPYQNANKTYIMDKNGLLTISGNVKEGNIKLQDKQTKTLSYTDGTEISYYKF